ncbi:hypothetical protein H0E87_017306 [Populus deltoides]|uniref:Uncharacterized protein n=1 Tax=Populus deltoides TaxID=3696 RepID=A0A8T2XZQ5_POPDE|nr:hypothetical protein H0E87_017306 [Populus deltoides]
MGVFLSSRGPNLLRFNLGRTKKYGFSGQLYDNVTHMAVLQVDFLVLCRSREALIFLLYIFLHQLGALQGLVTAWLVGHLLLSVQTMQGPYIRLPKFCFMNQCFSP